MGDWVVDVLVLMIIVVLFALYTFLPELLFHIWHLGTLYRGSPGPRRVALTFDDGPDREYTPQVLQILRDADVKATFFLVSQNAADNPDLVRQMVDEGHDIGSHSYVHRHHWLLDPITTWRDVSRGKHSIEKLSGQSIRFFRPPWGAFNWFTRLACTLLRLKPTLWSARAIDWLPGDYADEVEDRVVKGAHPGAIVLCHDAGGAEGSTQNTVTALPGIIRRLRELGYEFATVTEMAESYATHRAQARRLFDGYPFWRRMLIGLWAVVEVVFARWFQIVGVNEIFRISRTVWHHGPRYEVETDTLNIVDAADTPDIAQSNPGQSNPGRRHEVVRDGGHSLDLHFRNETLITISSAADHRALVRGLRQAKDGLRDIARILLYHPDYQDIEVIAAPTLMNRGIEMLGFHVEDLPRTRENLRLQRYMRFLMGMYHPEGFRRLHEGTRELEIKLVWMTKDELLKRTGLSTAMGVSTATDAKE